MRPYSVFMFKPLVSLMVALVAAPAAAETLVGSAQVVDGDTLRIGDTKIRLFGIDAPETSQRCMRGGESWACGEASTNQLQSLIGHAPVTCTIRGLDEYGRSVAVCWAAGNELNRTMVAYGWAVAFRQYSSDYISDKSRAKGARAGIWGSQFKLPQDFRQAAMSVRGEVPAVTRGSRSTRPAAAPAVMGRCAIKGNRNRKGQWIYHLPGMPYYDATRAEEIFCTEVQAQAAGYRRAIVR